MPTQSNSKLITNRQLNFTLSPVDIYNKKEMPYSLSNYAIDGTWNQHQSIVLDVILDYMIKRLYSKYPSFPRSWRTKKVIQADAQSGRLLFSPSTILYLNKGPMDAFFKDGKMDILERERGNYEESPESERLPSFKDHLANYLKNYYEYQIFIETKKKTHRDFMLI